MELPNSLSDRSLLGHEPLLSYIVLYSSVESRHKGRQLVKNAVEEIQNNPKALAAAHEWIHLAFCSGRAVGPSAPDPELLAIFFQYYTRLGTGDCPKEYLRQQQRNFPNCCAAQITQATDRDVHNAGARGRGVIVGRGRGRGRGRTDRSHGSGLSSDRGQGHSNLKPAELSHKPELYEMEPSAAELTHKGSSIISLEVTSNISNALPLPSPKDHSSTRSGRQLLNPKRLKTTGAPRGRPRKSKISDSDAAPSSLICSISIPSRQELASGSQSHMHNTTHTRSGKQVLDNSYLSLKRSLEDENLQINDPGRPPVSSSVSTIPNALPQSTRPVRPLPRKVSTVHIPPKHGIPFHPVPEPSMRTLNQENVDCVMKDVGRNAPMTYFETILTPLENWNQTQDNDQDDVIDIDETANEIDTHVIGGAPPPVSSYVEAVKCNGSAMQPQKPPLPVMPPIWAQSRQEVCESVDYFRSYQGGVYSSKDIVKGYLLGGSPASRDIFHDDGKLIISHGGGKSENTLNCRVGPSRLQKAQDQEATDKSVRALLKSYKDGEPLVLLVDDKYALFPFDLSILSCTYVVLGAYWISHAWAEYQPASNDSGRVVRWKFAFRWCGKDDPWWAVPKREGTLDVFRNCQSSSNPQNSSTPDGTTMVTCKICTIMSPVVFSQGWMCFEPSCPSFWSLGGREPPQLDYDTAFLRPIAREFDHLPDPLPGKPGQAIDDITTSRTFSRGWHCGKCGRLSSRFKWEHWECSNCHSTYKVPGRLRVAKEFWHQIPSTNFTHSHLGKHSGITSCSQVLQMSNGRRLESLIFTLPQQRGRIHIILGTPLVNKRADEIFQQYQEQANKGELLLRRYPLKTNKVRGALLTNYFSQNSGEPYQYIGGTENTVPFDMAPSSVCGALALIKERSHLALERDVPFNEILSAAYMERQKMAFHSDNERGLGPIVASLSLGSAALMHFRPHAVSKDVKHEPIALSLALRHGDILIMEGHGVQQYYEHTVIPMNFRIAATARCIGTV